VSEERSRAPQAGLGSLEGVHVLVRRLWATVARALEPTKEAGSMLTLTPTAADAVRALVAGAPVNDDTGGIRISSGEETPQGTPLELALVDAPEAADEEIDAGGAHVFLEPRVAGFPRRQSSRRERRVRWPGAFLGARAGGGRAQPRQKSARVVAAHSDTARGVTPRAAGRAALEVVAREA
jgi:iron-sulfur cluster assembly protein